MRSIRSTFIGAAAAAALLLPACAPAPASLETDDQKASYALGLNEGTRYSAAGSLLDVDAFMRGFEDALAEAEPAIDPMELQAVMQGFSQRVQEAQMAEREAESTANQAAGAAYLEENAARDEVTVTESGLQYEVLQAGDGPRPEMGDRLRLHYTGTLVDGTEFDSSRDGEPVVFGVGDLIPGFNEALTLMPAGSRYRVVIPSDLAYGPQGSRGAIGPDATLIFDIEVLEILESQGN